MMNLYILLLYTFKNANTQHDLDSVNNLIIYFQIKKKIPIKK